MEKDVKKLAIEMYKDGVLLKTIESATGLNKSYISKMARKAGCISRKSTSGKKLNRYKCPNCKHLYNKGSNFCSNCGADVRTQEKLFTIELEWLRGNLFLLRTDEDKKRADKFTRDLINYLSSKM